MYHIDLVRKIFNINAKINLLETKSSRDDIIKQSNLPVEFIGAVLISKLAIRMVTTESSVSETIVRGSWGIFLLSQFYLSVQNKTKGVTNSHSQSP